jgi:hypothetical protein
LNGYSIRKQLPSQITSLEFVVIHFSFGNIFPWRRAELAKDGD